jgi:hypothetical protein
MFEERRRHPRECLALPLQLASGARATTRDISGSGLYVFIQGWHTVDSPLRFELQLTDFPLKFTARGEVVRVEYHGDATGIALRLVNPRLHVLHRDR